VVEHGVDAAGREFADARGQVRVAVVDGLDAEGAEFVVVPGLAVPMTRTPACRASWTRVTPTPPRRRSPGAAIS
jgi:hypothetical protein